jgi:hypothetical protein
VIAIIPIAFLVPAAVVLTPPAVMLIPAALPRLAQFAPLVISLAAVTPMMLDCLVQFVFSMLNPALTPLVDIFP